MHSQWGTSPFSVRHIPIPSGDMHSQWGTSPFPVRHTPILGESHLHSQWGCASPGMHILTGNGDVLHWEWGCVSPGMHILTGNAHSLYRVSTREWITSESIFGVRLAKVLNLTGHFAQSLGRRRSMWSTYGQKSLPVAVQSGKGHICFTKPFLLKMGGEISGWRFLKI